MQELDLSAALYTGAIQQRDLWFFGILCILSSKHFNQETIDSNCLKALATIYETADRTHEPYLQDKIWQQIVKWMCLLVSLRAYLMSNMTLHVKKSICMTAEFGATPKYIDIKTRLKQLGQDHIYVHVRVLINEGA